MSTSNTKDLTPYCILLLLVFKLDSNYIAVLFLISPFWTVDELLTSMTLMKPSHTYWMNPESSVDLDQNMTIIMTKCRIDLKQLHGVIEIFKR